MKYIYNIGIQSTKTYEPRHCGIEAVTTSTGTMLSAKKEGKAAVEAPPQRGTAQCGGGGK